jgi:hypothetical protein
VYTTIGQPERCVEWCRAQLARGRDTHTITQASLVCALAIAGAGEEARAAANGLIEAAEATHNPYALSNALHTYGGYAYRDADPVRALEASRRGLVIAQHSGNRLVESQLVIVLSRLEAERGDPLAALDHITLAIRTFYDSGNVAYIGFALATLAVFLDRLGHLKPAATIAGFAFSPRTTSAVPQRSRVIAHLRDVLGDQTYESLARKGETMTTAAMVTYAYAQIDQARTELEHPDAVQALGIERSAARRRMKKRVCYIQSIPSINGRDSLLGRLLVDHLRREFDVYLCDCVLATDVSEGVHNIPATDFPHHQFDAVYIEGGLYWGWDPNAKPKIELGLLRPFVDQGGVAIIADVGRNKATWARDQSPYASAHELFGTAPDWGESGEALRYGETELIAYPSQMLVQRWLEPVYDGIDRLLVLQPLALRPGGTAVASGLSLATDNADSSKVLALDKFVNAASTLMFASVRQIGLGYIVLIAGMVSDDFVVKKCPDNARWISNLIRFLSDEAGRERERRSRPTRGSKSLALAADEWAAELGKLAADHNLVERRLRKLVAQYLLGEETRRGEPRWAIERALSALDSARRGSIDAVTIDAVLEQMYWPELLAVVSRNWPIFQKIFCDKAAFQAKGRILNDRPHAHAKSVDAADVALYRRELAWFKLRLDAAK